MNLVWDPASTRGAPLKDDWILPWYGSYPCVLRLLSTKIYGLETREDSLIPSIPESSAPFIVSSIIAWFRIQKWQNWPFVCTCCTKFNCLFLSVSAHLCSRSDPPNSNVIALFNPVMILKFSGSGHGSVLSLAHRTRSAAKYKIVGRYYQNLTASSPVAGCSSNEP